MQPAQIYLNMEKAIKNKTLIEDQELSATNQATKERANRKNKRHRLIKKFTDDTYAAMVRNGLETKNINKVRLPLPYSKEEFYEAFYCKYPDSPNVKLETFFKCNENTPIVKFRKGNKPKNNKSLKKLLNLN